METKSGWKAGSKKVWSWGKYDVGKDDVLGKV